MKNDFNIECDSSNNRQSPQQQSTWTTIRLKCLGKIARIAATATVQMPFIGDILSTVLNENKYSKCDHKMRFIYIARLLSIGRLLHLLFAVCLFFLYAFQIELTNNTHTHPSNESNMNIVFIKTKHLNVVVGPH